MSGARRQRRSIRRFSDLSKNVACFGFRKFSQDCIHKWRGRALSRHFDEFDTLEDRGAGRNSGKKLQLIRAESQRDQHLAIKSIKFLRRCSSQSLIEHRLPAQRSHHQFGGESAIARGKIRKRIGMEQFTSVRIIALYAKKNFESHGPRSGNSHPDYCPR